MQPWLSLLFVYFFSLQSAYTGSFVYHTLKWEDVVISNRRGRSGSGRGIKNPAARGVKTVGRHTEAV